MSEFNIEVAGGSSVRLPTAGKYCPKDIVVTASGGGGAVDGDTTAAEIIEGIRVLRNSVAKSVAVARFQAAAVQTVDLPAAERIGDSAFQQCDSLETINLPKAITVESEAFAGCTKLTTVTLPMVTEIYSRAFCECTGLTAVNFPKLEDIGSYGLAECIHLTTIDAPVVTTVSMGAFASCHGLTSVNFPNLKSVADGVFANCYALAKVDLSMATSIGPLAFYECNSLSALILRTTETVCVIDLTAFDDSGFLANPSNENYYGNGHIYVPSVMYEYYRAGYEEPLASALGAGAFDRIVRKIEDYPEICA